MTTLDKSRFTESDTVVLDNPSDFEGETTWYDDEGEQHSRDGIELPEDGEYEIVSIDYDRGFVYNLRLDGSVDDEDYVRVWGVPEEAIRLK
jgi:hypothetical protein